MNLCKRAGEKQGDISTFCFCLVFDFLCVAFLKTSSAEAIGEFTNQASDPEPKTLDQQKLNTHA